MADTESKASIPAAGLEEDQQLRAPRVQAPEWAVVRFFGETPIVADDWHSSVGWELHEQEWVSANSAENLITWKTSVPASFRFICEGWHEGSGELSIFGRASESSHSPHWGYTFHLGAESNTCAKLCRQGAPVQALAGPMVEAKRRYRLELYYDDYLCMVSCLVNGARIFCWRDLLPFPGAQLGFYTWGRGAHLRPIEVQYVLQPELSMLRRADSIFDAGQFKTALKYYRVIVDRAADPLERLLARYKTGLALLRMEYVPQAREMFESLQGTPLEPYALAEQAYFHFSDSVHYVPQRAAALLEDMFERFPDSEAQFMVTRFIGGKLRSREYTFGPTRSADLAVRGSITRLASKMAGPPTNTQVRSAVESARIAWLKGLWADSLEILENVYYRLAGVQQQTYAINLALYIAALANGQEDVLPPSFAPKDWSNQWWPDWGSGVLSHCILRTRGAAEFLSGREALVEREPNIAGSFDYKHLSLLLHLAQGQIAEATAWLSSAFMQPNLKYQNSLPYHWIGTTLVEARQTDLLDTWLAFMPTHARTSPLDAGDVDRSIHILRARMALEGRDFESAARALHDCSVPSLIFHFADGLVLQALLSSLGLSLALSRDELIAGLEQRTDGAELELGQMFLGLREPSPTPLWPHPRWRPEWRLWLALWLEAKGRRREAKEVAEPALDARYGAIHSQPALHALIERASQ